MAGAVQANAVGIVLYPGVQMAAVHGLTDLFGIASRFATEAETGNSSGLRVTHWSLLKDEISCVYPSMPSASRAPSILILPPTLVVLPDPAYRAVLGRWLERQHARGVRLVTICSGAFLLAESGVLDGRTVSTHRSCARDLVEMFPKVRVDVDRRMIDHEDVLTAGGFMAWVDVALKIIEDVLGARVRAETSQFIEHGHRAALDGSLHDFTLPQSHSDAAILRAQEHAHLRDGKGVSLSDMAFVAKLERRTFLRRFLRATRMTPIAYCRALRIARARELLEAGAMPPKNIATALGFADVGSFSRAFRRAYGIPPAAFRRQIGGATTPVAAAVSQPYARAQPAEARKT